MWLDLCASIFKAANFKYMNGLSPCTCILSIVAKPPIIIPQLQAQETDIEETIARLRELDPTLTTLNLNNHPRLEEDLFQQLCDALVANTYLTSLELAGTKLGDNHAKVRVYALCNC